MSKPDTTLCRECGKERALSPEGICIPCYDKSKTTDFEKKWGWCARHPLATIILLLGMAAWCFYMGITS